MQTVRTMIAGRRNIAEMALRAAIVIGAALFVCGCNTDQQVAGVPSVPVDYRMRHPITIKESDRTLDQGRLAEDGKRRLEMYARVCPREPHAAEAARLAK